MSRHSEHISQHLYRLRIDAIKWQMRLDLERSLTDFATRWGVTR